MDAVEEIKQRLSIEDVVSEYVQLKRSGRNLKGLSPFTSEKTPSFMVSPEKQIWHDFSSSKGGDMFSFLMEVEGLDFKGALELLARKAGVDLDKYRSTGRRSGPDKERLMKVNEAAARFYQVQFSRNNTALEYVLKKRGFSKETALEWRLGYSPNPPAGGGTALVDYLKKQGFSEEEVKLAGLSSRNYRGLSDMFRGRLIIPLQDQQGKVIGFTARLLNDDPNAPKYINTPQTAIYDKSRHVFGLHLAKESIRKGGFSVLAEGNLDVISSHQAGVRQTVATAGTALTEYQLKTLGRFAPDVRLAFDQDRAGLAATERAIPIASKVGVNLSIITVPSGKDPDELIRQNPKQWQQVINQPQYALDWLMTRYEKLLDVTSAEGKRKFSDVLLPIINNLSDAVEKDHYLNAIAQKIGVSREALLQKQHSIVSVMRSTRQKPIKPQVPLDKTTIENLKAQDHLLAVALQHPELREYLDLITPEVLFTDQAREFLKFLKEPSNKPPKQVQSWTDYDKILQFQYEELYQGLELTELRYEAARLQARLIDQYVKTEKAKLKAKFDTATDAEVEILLGRAKELDALLRQVKGGINGQTQETGG